MNQKLEAFLLGLVALVVMDAYVRDSPTPQNDELIYHRMASEPFETHTFVFAYRVAVPTLDWGRIIPLAALAVGSFMAMNIGYAVYMYEVC